MENQADGRGEAIVAAVAAEAGVVGELLGVVAEVELVVGLEEVAGGDDELGLAVALEAGAGHDVEDAVGAVADVGGVAAALDLDVVDVFRADLSGEVASDVGVGNFDAVEEPADLMAAADVEHVVGDVGAGGEVGDHGEGVGAVSAGSEGDGLAVDKGGGGDGVDVGGVSRVFNRDGLLHGAELQLEVEVWCGVGGQGEGLFCCREAGLRDGDDVVAEGDGGEREGAVGDGECGLGEGGVGRAEFDVGAGDGAVLRVVNDSVDLAEDGGAGRGGTQEKKQETK